MRVIELEEIPSGLDESATLEAVATGFQQIARSVWQRLRKGNA